MTFRLAPEVRGALGLKAVAALTCAGAVFYFAMQPVSATAAELQRWSGGGQPAFSLPTIGGAAAALEAARGHGCQRPGLVTIKNSCVFRG